MHAGLERTYRDYIAVLNDRRFADLGRFVAERVVYNGDPWSLERYLALLESDVRTIPDLRYDVELLVVDGDRVAARLHFDCHPTGTFLGMQTDGRPLTFSEHAFYRFEDDRIAQVTSIIDADAVRRQLAGPRP